MDFATISQWLGHASVNTTMHYAPADVDLKRDVISQVFPEPLAPSKRANLVRNDADITECLRHL